MKRRWLIGTLSIVVIGGAAWKWASSPRAETPVQIAKPVAVALVTRESLSRDIHLNAELRPYQEADLHAKVAGYLKTLNVDIGDQVKAGQVLATLDIAELQDDLNRARAAYRDAKLDYGRVSAVIKKRPGLLAQEEVDKAQAAYEMAKANMERAQTFLDYSTIQAPFDGVITKRYVDPGALIQAGVNSSTQAQPIVHLAQNTRLRLDFPVPESEVTQVHPGTPVTVTVQATNQVIESKVARISGKIDSNTRTMATEVDIDNQDLRITPGMYASVAIALESKKDVLVLPVQAVGGGDKPNVWLVNHDDIIEEKPVTLGLQTADKVEVAGLTEGDKAIFGSRGALAIGMKVTPKPIGGERP